MKAKKAFTFINLLIAVVVVVVAVAIAIGVTSLAFLLPLGKPLFSLKPIPTTFPLDNFFAIHDKNPDGCPEHTTIYLRNDTEENRTRIEVCKKGKHIYKIVIHYPKGNLPKECLYPDSDFYNPYLKTNHRNR